jgi:hypothetical protein
MTILFLHIYYSSLFIRWLNQIRQQISSFQGGRPDAKENQSNTNNLLQSYDI